MHVYMAAVYSNSYMPGMNRYVKLNEREQEIVTTLPHILESWHYVGKQAFVDHMRGNKAKIFLDSGAFSAFTLGVKLSVEDYVDYIYRNWDIIRGEDGNMMASVLDGIGDADETWRNQQQMEYLFQAKYGVDWKPLPCFHSGEPEHYLKKYVREYDYITLGGMVGASTDQLMIWLDRMWENFLTDGAGRPLCKVHGFGITSYPLMTAYPWYSCDSSSWIQTAAFGAVTMPDTPRGPMFNINVSDKSPSRHDAGQHATTLKPHEIDYVFKTLEKQGFTYERLSTVYESRAAYNLWSYGVINALVEASHRKNQFRLRERELY
jgi:hypothetical protein